jgi:predicted AlkP superfamily phosphohydrolase/phosphomutase
VSNHKVVVIGWDGAVWSVLHRYLDSHKLPTLERILQQGVAGDLKSTIPFYSGPAWASLSTGVNPGKHNIFHFCRTEGYDIRLVNGSFRRSVPVWDIIGQAGMEVAVINIPMTYPPEKVNGIMVSGMDTPSEKSRFTYPDNLREELLKQGYLITWGSKEFKQGRGAEFADALLEMERKRGDLVLKLLENPELRFLMVNFAATDRAQHFFWKHIGDSQNDWVLAICQELDSILGRILETIGDSGTLLLVSDHGFTSIYRHFAAGRWLLEEGLLKVKWRVPRYLIRKAGDTIEKFGGGGILAWAENQFPALRRKLEGARIDAWSPDWSKTQAWFPPTEGGIRINMKGREPSGIVSPGDEYEELRNRIIQKLEDLRDPYDGGKIIEKVFRREDIYSGPYVECAPDLIIQPVGGCAVGKSGSKPIMKPVSEGHHDGEHMLVGVLLAHGPDIKKGTNIGEACVYDIAPTVLHLLDLPVPAEMDGQVIKEAFESDSEAALREVRHSQRAGDTEDEKARIRGKIRALRRKNGTL